MTIPKVVLYKKKRVSNFVTISFLCLELYHIYNNMYICSMYTCVYISHSENNGYINKNHKIDKNAIYLHSSLNIVVITMYHIKV